MSVFLSGFMWNELKGGISKSPENRLWFKQFVCPMLWFIPNKPRKKTLIP